MLMRFTVALEATAWQDSSTMGNHDPGALALADIQERWCLQEIRLHEALDHRSEGLALLLYQFSTLKFIQGHLEDARKLSQRSAAIAEAVFKAGSDQVSS
jgi:hypothetical protein